MTHVLDLGPSHTKNHAEPLVGLNALGASLSDSSTNKVDDLTSERKLNQIVDIALQTRCDAVIWGDSSTRIAARVFSETARGKASALPSWIGEDAALRNVDFIYPLRDLLNLEVEAFAKLSGMSMDNLVDRGGSETNSGDQSSIDKLMSSYFGSLEITFPNIVTSVTRSATRLEKPEGS
jgi:cytoplasmic tRNA 2-thiolation protein 2